MISPEDVEKARSGNGVLPPEDLAQTVSSIQTVLSIYADGDGAEEEDEGDEDGEGNVVLEDADEAAIRRVAQYLRLPLSSLGDAHSTALRDSLPPTVTLGLRLRPWRGVKEEKAKRRGQALIVNVSYAVRRGSAKDTTSPDAIAWPTWKIQSAPWLLNEHITLLRKAGEQAAQGDRAARLAEASVNEDDHGALFTSHILLVLEAITEAALASL